MRPLGLYHEFASAIDGAPCVQVFTGLRGQSHNPKTGPMIQSWIMRADIAPHDALRTGDDTSVCGGCPLRPDNVRKAIAVAPPKTDKPPICYVGVARAPLQVWKTYRDGGYAQLDLRKAEHLTALLRLPLRLGAYGDPAAVPEQFWTFFWGMLEHFGAARWTAYTHQWRAARFAYLKAWCMASTDNEDGRAKAIAAGWRTFHLRRAAEEVHSDETICPASVEAGHKETCATCLVCNGRVKNVVIIDHGPTNRKPPKKETT